MGATLDIPASSDPGTRRYSVTRADGSRFVLRARSRSRVKLLDDVLWVFTLRGDSEWSEPGVASFDEVLP